MRQARAASGRATRPRRGGRTGGKNVRLTQRPRLVVGIEIGQRVDLEAIGDVTQAFAAVVFDRPRVIVVGQAPVALVFEALAFIGERRRRVAERIVALAVRTERVVVAEGGRVERVDRGADGQIVGDGIVEARIMRVGGEAGLGPFGQLVVALERRQGQHVVGIVAASGPRGRAFVVFGRR